MLPKWNLFAHNAAKEPRQKSRVGRYQKIDQLLPSTTKRLNAPAPLHCSRFDESLPFKF